jgi:hypothetical protein
MSPAPILDEGIEFEKRSNSMSHAHILDADDRQYVTIIPPTAQIWTRSFEYSERSEIPHSAFF